MEEIDKPQNDWDAPYVEGNMWNLPLYYNYQLLVDILVWWYSFLLGIKLDVLDSTNLNDTFDTKLL